MFLDQSDLSAQFDRFLKRIPKDVLRDVARPVEDAIRFAWRALRYEDAPPWEEVDGPDDTLGLRGFVVEIFFTSGFRPSRYVVVTEEHFADAPLPGDGRDVERPDAATDLCGTYYFVDRNRSLHRFAGHYDAATRTLNLGDKEATTIDALVAEHPENPYGPLGWGHDLMALQFEPLLRASRQRTGRLERLLAAVDRCTALHVDEVENFELVIEWDGEPAKPRLVRDVIRHAARATFLMRERINDSEPHSVIEFPTIEAAVEAANDGHAGYIRRRTPTEGGT